MMDTPTIPRILLLEFVKVGIWFQKDFISWISKDVRFLFLVSNSDSLFPVWVYLWTAHQSRFFINNAWKKKMIGSSKIMYLVS